MLDPNADPNKIVVTLELTMEEWLFLGAYVAIGKSHTEGNQKTLTQMSFAARMLMMTCPQSDASLGLKIKAAVAKVDEENPIA